MAIVVTQIGYTTVAGDPQNLVDGDLHTGWTPAAQVPSGGLSNGCIQFDLQSAFTMSSFACVFANPGSFGSAMLVCSDFDANLPPFNIIHDGDQVLGSYSRTVLGSGTPQAIATQTRPRRYFRLVGTNTADGATDGTELFEFQFSASANVPPAMPSDWDHIFSRGNQLVSTLSATGNGLIIACTQSPTLTGKQGVAFSQGFDASQGGGPFFTSATLVAGTDYFQWQMSEALVIDGLTFWGGDTTDLGIWQLAGSNDGSTFTACGSPFHWNQAANAVGTTFGCRVTGLTNTTAYLYYRLQYVSGVFHGGRLCAEIDFSIPHSSLGGGDRTGVVTISRHNMIELGSQLIGTLNDGKYVGGLPVGGTDQVLLNHAATGDYLQWQYPSAVNIVRFKVNNDSQFITNKGTWKWLGSNDGTTFTDSASGTFTINPTSRDPILQGGASGEFYKSWRLIAVAPTTNNWNGLYEFVFDLVESPFLLLTGAFSDGVDDALTAILEPPAPPLLLSGTFSDGDDDALTAILAAQPLSGAFSDGDSDALTATPTIIESSDNLSAAFTDGDSDVLGITVPRKVPVMISLMATGR